MELSVLELFIDVVRHGSFAAAAREHSFDPSSVSRAMSGLEDELGLRLFQRTTRKLSPTEAGMNYFSRIEPLVQELRAARESSADASGAPRGTLRVSASFSFGQRCIVPHLSSFQAKYPELTVELHLSDAVVDLVADRFDLAVRLGRPTDSTLIAQRLMRTRYYVCASPRYLKNAPAIREPRDLSAHNCLLFPLPGFRSNWRFLHKNGKELVVPISGNTIISSGFALEECARKGMGVALLAGWLVSDALKTGKLIDLFPGHQITATDFETSAWLVYPSRAYVPLKVRAFIEFLKKEVAPAEC